MAKKKLTVDHNKIELAVWQMAEPLVEQCLAELIDVEYVKEAGNWYLRLYIDREPAVDHDLCEQVSNLVSEAIDKNDPVPEAEAYYLEISSPGLERPLRRAADFSRFAGEQICVRLYAPQQGKKEFFGTLIGLSEGNVLIEAEGAQLSFAEQDVAKVHLVAEF